MNRGRGIQVFTRLSELNNLILNGYNTFDEKKNEEIIFQKT